MALLGSTQQEAVRLAIATALQQLDVDIVGYDTLHRVEWENKVGAQRAIDGLWVDLRIGYRRSETLDETRYLYTDNGTPETSTLQASVGGQREFLVTVTIGTDSQEGDEEAVFALSDRLATRMRREDVKAILRAGGVATISIGSSFNTDFKDMDARMCSRSITDIRFRAASFETDDADIGFIDRVEGTGADDTDLEGESFDTALEG